MARRSDGELRQEARTQWRVIREYVTRAKAHDDTRVSDETLRTYALELREMAQSLLDTSNELRLRRTEAPTQPTTLFRRSSR